MATMGVATQARWRRQKRQTGLSAVGAPIRGWDLMCGDSWLAHVRPKGRNAESGWYWYGMGNNTSHSPVATPEEAKQQVDAWHKECAAGKRATP